MQVSKASLIKNKIWKKSVSQMFGITDLICELNLYLSACDYSLPIIIPAGQSAVTANIKMTSFFNCVTRGLKVKPIDFRTEELIFVSNTYLGASYDCQIVYLKKCIISIYSIVLRLRIC